MMKDELSGTLMSDFVGLRSKVCAYLKEGDDETKAKTNWKVSKRISLKIKQYVRNTKMYYSEKWKAYQKLDII